MIVNGSALMRAKPIKDMETCKMYAHGTSYGLGEAGYDIRINQTVVFSPGTKYPRWTVTERDGACRGGTGRFALASATEMFQMPKDLVGTVKDKSTWARKGLSVFNTVIEPGWNGILTLELVFHGATRLIIPAGAGIAQVLFGRLQNDADYGDGKYQNATGIEEAKI